MSDDCPKAVFCYKGITYVGKNSGGIDSIDLQGNLTTFVGPGSKRVGSIQEYDGKLLMMRVGNLYQLCLYNLDGSFAKFCQQQGGDCRHGRRVVVAEDLALVASATLRQINVHCAKDLTLLRSTKCEAIPTGGYFSIGSLGGDKLILASYQGIISTLNHVTGHVTYTSSHKLRETAVQPLNDEIVVLSGCDWYNCRNDVSAKVLNIKTGFSALLQNTVIIRKTYSI